MMLEFELAKVLLQGCVGAVRSCSPLYRLLSTPNMQQIQNRGGEEGYQIVYDRVEGLDAD